MKCENNIQFLRCFFFFGVHVQYLQNAQTVCYIVFACIGVGIRVLVLHKHTLNLK